MNRSLPLALLSLCFVTCLEAKPPKTPVSQSPVAPQPTPVLPPATWLHWLLEQDGGPLAVPVPVMEVLRAVSHQDITGLKPTDPVDAAVVARISTALDTLLPRLNRPDGPVHLAPQLASVPALVDQELQASLASLPETECVPAAPPEDSTLGGTGARTYPALRLTDTASHRTYFLGTAFVPAGKAEAAPPLLQIDPTATGQRLGTGGVPLLIVLEHNGKTGKELALLNWQLVDLQTARVRLRMSFSATGEDMALPGSAVNDGRKGRD